MRYDEAVEQSFPERGYLYLVCGDLRFVRESAASARSLREVDPDAHITLVTDGQLASDADDLISVFDHVVIKPFAAQDTPQMQSRKGGIWPPDYNLFFLYRVQHLYKASPYRKTFFLDCDTYFVQSCRGLFSQLDHFDLCMAHSPADETAVRAGTEVLSGYTPYNCGVMLFRKNGAVQRLFDDWGDLFADRTRDYVHDQPAFMQALLFSTCRVYVLQNVWNARFPYYERFVGPVRLLHGRHDDFPQLARRINSTVANRVWLPDAEACVSSRMRLSDALRVTGACLTQLPLRAARKAARLLRAIGSKPSSDYQ